MGLSRGVGVGTGVIPRILEDSDFAGQEAWGSEREPVEGEDGKSFGKVFGLNTGRSDSVAKLFRMNSEDGQDLMKKLTTEHADEPSPGKLKRYSSVDSYSSLSNSRFSAVKGNGKGSITKVDLTRGIVAQVGYLGDAYDDWVHDPVIFKETPRFFDNDIAEYFTRTKWWVIPLVWVPVTFGMFYIAMNNGMTKGRFPYMFGLGILFWTFLEYVLHRFLFHMKTTGYWSNTFHYSLHGFHHKFPMDGTRLVMPPAIAAPITIVIWILMGDWMASYPDRLVLYGGTILAYVCYDLIHYFLHFGSSSNAHVKQLKRYHMIHHFKDQDHGYGITSKFWDHIFGTIPAKLHLK